MATWRYLVYDILSRAFVAELPLEDVDFEIKLPVAGPGNFAARLRVGDDRVRKTAWRPALEPRQNLCYSEREGVIVACHILWDAPYHPSNQTVELKGAEVWSAFQHRYISHDRTYAAVDQFDIARDLLLKEFGEPNGDIHLQVDPVGTTPLSGRVRDRTYLASDGKQLAEAIDQLSQVIDGFDFNVLAERDSATGVPRVRLVLGYPRLGRDDSGLYFQCPGDIADFTWAREGSRIAARAIALGANGLRADAIDWSQIGALNPLLEVVNSYPTVSDATTLMSHAQADLSSRTTVIGVPTVTIRSDLEPVLGTYQLGDDVWLILEDDAYFTPPWVSPDGVDYRVRQRFRLIGLHVRPDAESVELLLNSPAAIDAAVAARP